MATTGTKRLPRGRHKLSRAAVAASQRTRLLRATVALGSERGFGILTLADIVGCAGVARSTFYEHFANKQQCFLAAFDYAAERVLERVLTPRAPAAHPSSTLVDIYIAHLLALCEAEPGLVWLVASDAEVLGPQTAERQRAIRDRLADGLVKLRNLLRHQQPQLAPISHLRALAIVGAVTEILRYTFYAEGVGAFADLQVELSTVVLALLEARTATHRVPGCPGAG